MAKILREELIREKSKQNTTNVNGETENTEGKPKKKKKRKKKKKKSAQGFSAPFSESFVISSRQRHLQLVKLTASL